MKGLVIWAHSKCRSTFGLYRALRDLAGVPVRLAAREGVRDYRQAQGQCEDEFADMECPVVGEDWPRIEKILNETQGWTHLVAAYQESAVYRKIVRVAKRQGGVVGVISEQPWNAHFGLKAMAWDVYVRTVLRWRVRKAVAAAGFLINYSGGKDALARTIGWPREKIVPFGYYPQPLGTAEPMERPGGQIRVLATATKGRRGRGEALIRTAVGKMGDHVELVMPAFVDEDELKRLYAACDVFIAAGHDEPWGIRVNDALNFAKPVLVSSRMGARKLVDETGAGLVFESGSASDLADKLEALMSDLPRYAEKARAASALISPEAKARDLLSVLRSGEA